MRISGVTIPTNKAVFVSLSYIFGIGRHTALKICNAICISLTTKVSDLDMQMKNSLSAEIEKYTVEGELRRKIAMDIKELKSIGNYKGIRHSRRLPLRGQRTRTNARTRKGRARIPVAAKKKAV